MLTIFISTTILLFITTAIFFYYSIRVARQLLTFEQGFSQALGSIRGFKEHLERVNNYEIFTGEPVISDMMDHSKEVINDIEAFQESFTIKWEKKELKIIILLKCMKMQL